MDTTLSVIAVVLSTAALAVAIWTAMLNRRSAAAAEDSAASARVSADASKESAGHAKASADSAAVVARAETGRDHRELRPNVESKISTKTNSRTKRANRFFVFRPQRTYRVSGVALVDESQQPLAIGPVVEAGREVEIYLDEGHRGGQVDAIRLRFWPPIPGDPGEAWECPCGSSVDPSGAAHWEWTIEIPKSRPALVL